MLQYENQVENGQTNIQKAEIFLTYNINKTTGRYTKWSIKRNDLKL